MRAGGVVEGAISSPRVSNFLRCANFASAPRNGAGDSGGIRGMMFAGRARFVSNA
jgi:hypothetical protein